MNHCSMLFNDGCVECMGISDGTRHGHSESEESADLRVVRRWDKLVTYCLPIGSRHVRRKCTLSTKQKLEGQYCGPLLLVHKEPNIWRYGVQDYNVHSVPSCSLVEPTVPALSAMNAWIKHFRCLFANASPMSLLACQFMSLSFSLLIKL